MFSNWTTISADSGPVGKTPFWLTTVAAAVAVLVVAAVLVVVVDVEVVRAVVVVVVVGRVCRQSMGTRCS